MQLDQVAISSGVLGVKRDLNLNTGIPSCKLSRFFFHNLAENFSLLKEEQSIIIASSSVYFFHYDAIYKVKSALNGAITSPE